MQQVIKRKGQKETFNQKKIYNSVLAACRTLRIPDEEGETIAQMVSHDAHEQFKLSPEVQRHAVHKTVVVLLEKYNTDVAFLYDKHKELF